MKIFKIAKDNDYEKMRTFFEKRTNKHIKLVQKYCEKIAKYDEEKYGELIERGKSHDQTKFKDPEIEPYVYTTWQYKCKDDGVEFECPEGMEDKMNEATFHHVKNNAHHPENHCDQETDLINKKDRDKPPEKMIDATKMKDIDIAEMVADWCSVSEERGNTPKAWADKNVNIRWEFTDDQKDLIYELIDVCWGK